MTESLQFVILQLSKVFKSSKHAGNCCKSVFTTFHIRLLKPYKIIVKAIYKNVVLKEQICCRNNCYDIGYYMYCQAVSVYMTAVPFMVFRCQDLPSDSVKAIFTPASACCNVTLYVRVDFCCYKSSGVVHIVMQFIQVADTLCWKTIQQYNISLNRHSAVPVYIF